MGAGWRVIEVAGGFQNQATLRPVLRIWVVNRHGDERCVYAEDANIIPELGGEIWWEGDVVFLPNRAVMRMVGPAFAPTERERADT